METEIIGTTQILTDKGPQSIQNVLTGGFLDQGDTVAGFCITGKLQTSSGEAELYTCEKDGKKYILKLFFAGSRSMDALLMKKIASFRHPDILQIITYGEYNNRFYEVLEYAEGGSVNACNPDGSYKYLPLSPERLNTVLRETVNAFESFHTEGIIHRDIKPDNLLFRNADGTDLVVGDFGIARGIDVDEGLTKHMTETNEGTIGYTAPEVASGVIGAELDYYALGITIWVLLTGREPFCETDGKPMFPGSVTLECIQGKTADRLLSMTPDMDPRMAQLIRGLLTVRHEKRWGYKQVMEFLNGGNPRVFEEKRDLPPFSIGSHTCYSFSEISRTLFEDTALGEEVLYGNILSKYLAKIDESRVLFNKIVDITEKYSASEERQRGVCIAAHTLSSGQEFYISKKCYFSTVSDIIEILQDNYHPLMSRFMKSDDLVYLYMETAGMGKIAEEIRMICSENANEIAAKDALLSSLTENSMVLCKDEDGNDIVLQHAEDFSALSSSLKERFLYRLYQNDGMVRSWIQNVYGISADGYVDCIRKYQNAGFIHWGDVSCFEEYLSGQNIITSRILTEDVEKNPCEEARKYKEKDAFLAVNVIVESYADKLFENNNLEDALTLYLSVRNDHMEGLSKGIGYYKYQVGRCYQLQRDIAKARVYFSQAIELGYTDAMAFCRYADIEFQLKRYDIAREYYTKAAACEKNDLFFIKLANIYLVQNDLVKAVAAAEEAAAIRDKKSTFMLISKLYGMMSPPMKDKAEAALKKAASCNE